MIFQDGNDNHHIKTFYNVKQGTFIVDIWNEMTRDYPQYTWYTATNNQVLYTFAPLMPPNNLTFYGNAKGNAFYTINYIENGTNEYIKPPYTFTASDNTKLKASDYIAFPGFQVTSKAGDGSETAQPVPPGPKTFEYRLYYNRLSYPLTFESLGTTLSTSFMVPYDRALQPYYITPPTPADLPGYTFGGWYYHPSTIPETRVNWETDRMPYPALKLFAQWIPPTYAVQFIYPLPDGGNGAEPTQRVFPGGRATRPTGPSVIPGYTFDGWYYQGTNTPFHFDTNIYNSLVLTGRYVPSTNISYKVRYLKATDNSIVFPDKIVSGQTMGAKVTEEALWPQSGALVPDLRSKTLTIGAGVNELIFWYTDTPQAALTYTVHYLENDTLVLLSAPVTKTAASMQVTETAKTIQNFPYQMPGNHVVYMDFLPDRAEKTLKLTTTPSDNVLTFYYQPLIKYHYYVRYLEQGTNTPLAMERHVVTTNNNVVERARDIANYLPASFTSTHAGAGYSVSGSGAYVSTATYEVDENSATPQIITFYYTAEKIAVTGQKTWVDNDDAEGKRPTSLKLTIYQNGVRMDPQPGFTWNKSGDTWTYAFLNLPAAYHGQAYRYTVREDVPPLYQNTFVDKNTFDGTNLTNTLDGGTFTFTGTKTWVDWMDGAFNPRPASLDLIIYKKAFGDADFVPMTEQPDIAWDKTTAPNVWTYTVNDLKKYDGGHPILYKAEEIIPSGYVQTANDGSHFENTVVEITANKVWLDGPETKPDIWLRLYRNTEGQNPVIVQNASIKRLQSGTTTATWLGLAQKDTQGKPYIYTVQEVNAGGDTSFQPLNYIKTQTGLTVTNQYVIPKNGVAAATKTWTGGPSDRPELWLQLWRKTTTGDAALDAPQAVPGAEVKKANATGNTNFSWASLETTDIKGNPYTFFVKEGQWDGSAFTPGTPVNYDLTGEDTLHLTNTYVIPKKGTVTATKTWVDGEHMAKPELVFRLLRKISGGAFAPVPDASVLTLPTQAPFEVTWNQLEETDNLGRPYEFAVEEGTYGGGTFTPGSPLPFVLTLGAGTKDLTNTYNSPLREDIVVYKKWETTGTLPAPGTEVTLELWRRSDNEEENAVGSVLLDGITDAVEFESWQAKFTNLPEFDKTGLSYTYEVRELVVPGNYVVTYDQDNFTVTNTWQTKSYTARKIWQGGYAGQVHPALTIQLWRESETTPLEKVGNPVLQPATSENQADHTWDNLPVADASGKEYTYSFTETRLPGYTPTGPEKVDGVDTLTNTYEGISISATKVISLPEGNLPENTSFSFVITRNDGWTQTVRLKGIADTPALDGSGETAPSVDTQGRANWHYTWHNLPKLDENGQPYTYTVTEPNPPSGFLRLSTLGDMEDGFVITNEYRQDTYRAFKYWDTQDGTAPVTFRLLQWLLDDAGQVEDPVNGWSDMQMDLVLNGIPDDQESPRPNSASFFEDTPWRAVWTGLDTEYSGQSVKYSVEEVVSSEYNLRFDAVTAASTVVHNTSLFTNITGQKVWVGGEALPRPEVMLTLSRYLVDGTTLDTVFEPQQFTLKGVISADETEAWAYTFKSLPRFYTEDGVRKAYVYQVTEDTPSGYELTDTKVSEDKTQYTFTNTYISSTKEIKAAKVWDGGATRPTVTFRLQRRLVGESDWVNANPLSPGQNLNGSAETEPGEMTGAYEYAPWKMKGIVPLTDSAGRAYEYRVLENNQVPGYKPATYAQNQMVDGEHFDFVVTNTFDIKTDGIAIAKKVFTQGIEVEKPDVYFQLYRKTATGEPEVVLGQALVNIKEQVDYSYTFTGLETTTKNAEPYTFYVVEGVMENGEFKESAQIGNFVYDAGAGSLTLENRYVSPQTTKATATKTWVDGPEDNKTSVDLILYRKTAQTGPELVPMEELVEPTETLVDGIYHYQYAGLKDTDEEGRPYTYFVREEGESGGFVTLNQDKYKVEYTEVNNDTAITNTYVPPMEGTHQATKMWKNGPESNQLPIKLSLWRKVVVDYEVVTDEPVPQKEDQPLWHGEAPEFIYEWTGLTQRDSKGRDYTFYVMEEDVEHGDIIDIEGSKYLVSYNDSGNYITNTYQIPMDVEITVQKTWEKGPATRPEVWLRLMRRLVDTSAFAPMPQSEMPEGQWAIVSLPESNSVTWTGLPGTDLDGDVYVYTAQEGLLADGVFTPRAPQHYTVSGQNSLQITNTYVPPKADVEAFKSWVNGPLPRPDIWLSLQRSTDGDTFVDVPGLQAQLLPSGQSGLVFEAVEQTDENGKPYTFQVLEGFLDAAGNFEQSAIEYYVTTPMTDKLGLINTYQSPKIDQTATKNWLGQGPEPYPTVVFQLQRKSSATAEFTPVSGSEKQVVTQLGQTKTQVTWNQVDERDSDGVPYTYRVVEGRLVDGVFTPSAPANYQKSEIGMSVYNTWQTISISVQKIWEGEPSPAYNLSARTATFELYSQYEGQTAPDKTLVDTVVLDGTPKGTGTGELSAWKYTWGALPKFDSENRELTYSVVETQVPASYEKGEPVAVTGGFTVTNTFQKADLKVSKVYSGTIVRPPVTIVIFQDGTEIHRMELDGVQDVNVAPNTPYESDLPGVGIWPSLPVYNENGEKHIYTVTELIPEGDFPYRREISKTGDYTFAITNTYHNGTIVVLKYWDLGTASPAQSVTLQLWREVTDQHGNKSQEYVDNHDAILDGVVDLTPGEHGRESRSWEYTWNNLVLNGNLDNDPSQPVSYRYYARELAVPQGFVLDTENSTGFYIRNVAVEAPVTAQKVWGGQPADNGTWFQLYREVEGQASEKVGGIVHLDGLTDNNNGTGELSAWAYTWAQMPRFVNTTDHEGNLVPDLSKRYTYFVREVDSDGELGAPQGFALYQDGTLRLINVQIKDITAKKTWEGGEAQRQNGIGPGLYFTLQRRTIGQDPEEAVDVPAEDLNGQEARQAVPLMPNEVTLTWEDLPMAAPDGSEYIYSVVETDAASEPSTLWVGEGQYIYRVKQDVTDELAITNIFESPKKDVTARKLWHGLKEEETRPEVLIKLYRGLDEQSQEPVDEDQSAPWRIEGGSHDPDLVFEHTWTVDQFDPAGQPYVYTTQEVAAPQGFQNVPDGMDQHNIKLIDVLASKKWADVPEGASLPKVTLVLMANGQTVDQFSPVSFDVTGFSHTFTAWPTHEMDADMKPVQI